jgi:hypothetical protein
MRTNVAMVTQYHPRMTDSPVSILSVGWGSQLIRDLLLPAERQSVARFTHCAIGKRNAAAIERAIPGALVRVAGVSTAPREIDLGLLASLETDGVPTINTMILGDRVLKRRARERTLAYASSLALSLLRIVREERPQLVLGGFDGLHGSLGLAVCRFLGVRWACMNFTTIPRGLMNFCTSICPDDSLEIPGISPQEARVLAEREFEAFVSRKSVVPAYHSASSVRMVLSRSPAHFRRLAGSVSGWRDPVNRCLEPTPVELAGDWCRKRVNMLRLGGSNAIRSLPGRRYALYALHMQPESSIDAWAPFFSDQLSIIEAMARSLPVDHSLAVKLHVSDADNYSRRQLARLAAIPGVSVIHPSVSSRVLLEGSSLVFGIMGTVCLEAALLGKPVVMFGRSPYLRFPSVRRAGALDTLPSLVRESLRRECPDSSEILDAFTRFISRFMQFRYNDWTVAVTADEQARFSECLRRLLAFERPPCST